MNSPQPTPQTIVNETWIEVVMNNGQIHHVPLPPSASLASLFMDDGPLVSSSAITGFTYALSFEQAIAIRQYEKTNDPARLARSRQRALGQIGPQDEGPSWPEG